MQLVLNLLNGAEALSKTYRNWWDRGKSRDQPLDLGRDRNGESEWGTSDLWVAGENVKVMLKGIVYIERKVTIEWVVG